MPITVSDLKYAIRLLLKSPGFTLLTVLVLAGGLGTSIYTFAALNTLMYRSLPVPEGGSIVRVGEGDWPNFEPLGAFELARIREDAQGIRELGAYRESRALVGEPGASRTILSAQADWRIFEFTRTRPLLGRGFVLADSVASAEPVTVIGYETWQSVFSGEPDVVGRLVGVNGGLTRIVGVMPEGYTFPTMARLWLPLSQQDLDPPTHAGSTFDAYARLAPGASAETAAAELTALVRRLRAEQPGADESVDATVQILTFQEASWGTLRTLVFGVLNLLSLSILLLAAVNVGNLLLARTNARINEIGVRVALGAPKLRLIAQSMLENTILCAIGGALAMLFAARALSATNSFMSSLLGELPFGWTWTLDREVVMVAALFLLLTILIVSVLPASSVSRADPNALLKDGVRGGRRGMGRISRILVTIQVALISAVMVVGGAVTVIAERVARFDFGMDTTDLFMMNVELPGNRYATTEQRLSLSERLLTELRETPGIAAAGVMAQVDLARFAPAGREYATVEARPGAWLFVLSETPTPLGPPLVEGRAFDTRDDATGLKTAIVSRTLARTQWPNESALGQLIDVSIGDLPVEQRLIVGVVGDVRYDPAGVTPVGLSTIYVPLPQFVPQSAHLIVRGFGSSEQARGAMYQALDRIDPALAPDIRTYASALESMTLLARTMTKLFAGCGGLAILLAVSGIYGMSSNAVVLRSQEIGLRRALGATSRDVISMFIAQGARQLGVGVALSTLLCAVGLFAIQQGFSIGPTALALIGSTVLVIVSASVLLSVYVSVRGVIRREPSAALRCA